MQNFLIRSSIINRQTVEAVSYTHLGAASIMGMGLDQFDRMNHKVENETFDVIKTHEGLPAFVDKLIEAGFTEAEIKGFLGENLMRLLKSTIG